MRPDVSICVATFRRPDGLDRLLRSLSRLKLPDGVGVEILVVDNDEDRSARSVVDAHRSMLAALEYLHEPHQNIAHARNRAVSVARGEWLLFVDDDEVADEDWVVAYLDLLEATPCDGAFGPVLPKLERPVTRWLDVGTFYSRARHATGTAVPRAELRTSNAAIRRASLGDARFDPAFGRSGGSDSDLFGRLADAGARFVWCDEAQVVEFVPPQRHRPRWLVQRAFRGGCVYTRIERRRDPQGANRRALRAALALAACAVGAPIALLAGRARCLRVVQRGATQAGHLWSWRGGAYEEY